MASHHSILTDRDVLGVFAKRPVAGQVKTRLAATFGADCSARIYEAFLRDFLPRLHALTARRVLAHSPADSAAFFRELAGEHFQLEAQAGGELGQRMRAFCERQFARGAERVVVIGSDTPDLPVARIEQAFDELVRREVVIGPCEDGGYYLIGMNRFVPALFDGVDWGSAMVFCQTLDQLSRLSLRLSLLEPWYDVDRVNDLIALARRMAEARSDRGETGLPHTEALLHELPNIL